MLGLQEVDVGMARTDRVDTVERLAVATGMVAAFGVALRLDDGEYGNALLVRGGMADVEVIPLPGADGDEPRSLLSALVDGVRVVVAHLSARAPRPQLVAALDEVGAAPGPVVLMGDLNLPYATVERDCGAAGFELLGPADPTYPSDAPAVRIDHIAVRGLSGGHTLTTGLAPVSDHRALVADISWPG